MIRRRIILVVLLALFAGFGFFIFKRAGSVATADTADSPSTPTQRADAGGATVASADANRDASTNPDAVASGLERTLRVVSPDVELLAPGVVANGGMTTEEGSLYDESDLEVAFSSTDGMTKLRESLARGGSEENGADIAIVSLPSFVASYEQLRALKPVVFFVTGWSRGREAVATTRPDAFVDPPDDESIAVRGVSGEPATFLTLFAMDLAGIDLETVEFTDDADEDVPFAAVARSWPDLDEVPDDHRQLLSTSEALGLIPFVAIAPNGFVEKHPETLYRWTATWLEGREELGGDVPKAARLVASSAEDAEPLELIDLLGWIEFASPVDNARLAGLSGRQAANLDPLFRRTWRIWRDAGELTTPTPEVFPINTETIMELVRTEADTDERPKTDGSEGGEEEAEEEEAEPPAGDVLLVYRWLEDELDREAFVGEIGLLADIFRRSKLRVTVDWNQSRTDEMVEQARERFDIPKRRIHGGRSVPGDGTASVEIFEIE